MKVSHHGSCKNTSKELLEIINTSNYIISTSSESHNHPDKRTLSRILNNNPKATIYFNYDEVLKHIFSTKDFQDFKNLYAKNVSEYNIEWE
jgi:acetyl-CoA carboxylase carboxyltransferase component